MEKKLRAADSRGSKSSRCLQAEPVPPQGQVLSSHSPLLLLCLARQNDLKEEEAEEHVMATGELNPNHYPAHRAAKVVQHYLNARYGSPYRLFGLQQVHSGNAQVSYLVSI